MKRFAITTLGCKVNQYESAIITDSLKRFGYKQVSFTEKADIYIVNTCTVTSKASYQSRQMLRRALRLNPEAIVVAAGCYSEIEAKKIASLGIATHILGNVEKLNLERYLERPGSLSEPFIKVSAIKRTSELEAVTLEDFPDRTRAFLRIQDGCNTFCTYCIVPYTRGRSRSLRRSEVLKQVENFISHGFKEIVLTGIHLGKWGEDLSPSDTLSSLLAELLTKFPECRFRISSIEPPELTDNILELMAERSNFCKHLHVPLQSASKEILKTMHRPYSPEYYWDLFWKAHSTIPDLAWGLDVIVGFPGETKTHFSETLKFIEELPVSYLHVFPFSPRERTPAARFPEQVPGREKKRRVRLLRELSNRKRREFMSKFVGKTLEVLVEGQSKKIKGLSYGLSSNYIRVYFEGKQMQSNTFALVKIEKLIDNGLSGQIVKEEK
ncbi:MAG: tRNA (N(6)-L-threonylcarbamoyladenosine(37)-C(2))-methylthiotransferase MtaB [Deltaproteobacteria bacterium]|nr:MAG: tRNA (N(6)-L-threonylcarbamoyladenosine(37)-C(2))-methylthiotransferase MtaB [Deltaproteobacteria bacterium]